MMEIFPVVHDFAEVTYEELATPSALLTTVLEIVWVGRPLTNLSWPKCRS